MKVTLVLFSSLVINVFSLSYIVNPGPVVKATIGGVWPKPKYQRSTDNFFVLDPNNFEFETIGYSCDIVKQAFVRYKNIIANSVNGLIYHDPEVENLPKDIVSTVLVNLTAPCELRPYLKMDEFYFLSSRGDIVSHSVWGVLRALETYSQLVTPYKNKLLRVRETQILDEPRFPHRGLLLDTSRHFISMENIYKILDGMAYNKLNVFHWHIVDDHSFPYESINFPELSAEGAYTPNMTYSQKNVADIIEYARLRGIRVIAEFDVPGHTNSWGISHPELLTECEGEYEGKLGPINPIKQESYDFLSQFFREIGNVFPDQYLHLGGDEVAFECWESNSEITNYITENNISSYGDLQRQFMEKVSQSVHSMQKTPIVWQEAMIGNPKLPIGTIVQVWLGDWRSLFKQFTEEGHPVLMSHCWYLDHIANGGDWEKFYSCEPHDFLGTDDQEKLVLGGEACMWSESVSDRNVLQRIFPRVSAAAERLWSLRETTNIYNAQRRIEEHTCRLLTRGIPAQPPNGPGIC